jgi:hypothetical protein
MKRVSVRAAAAAALLWAIGPAVTYAQPSRTFKARLAPVPMDLTMAASVAGSGAVTAVLAGRTLTINGTFEGLKSPATIAQLHKSPVAGVRGPMLFDLKVSSGTAGSVSGSMELTPGQIEDLEKRRLYIQLHSEKAPEGNLWGWLVAQEARR